jgi:hypothetical protein
MGSTTTKQRHAPRPHRLLLGSGALARPPLDLGVARGLLSLAVIAGMVACAAPFEMYAAAEARAPADLGCPKDQVAQYHHARYTFQGCGRYVRYHCMWSDQAICVPQLVAAGPP